MVGTQDGMHLGATRAEGAHERCHREQAILAKREEAGQSGLSLAAGFMR